MDITLCVNSTCNKRFSCYRYKAEWDKDSWQSYSRFEAGDCFYHSPIRPQDKIVSDQEADKRINL